MVKSTDEVDMELLDKPSNDGDALLEIVSKIKDNKEVFDFYKDAQLHLIALEGSTFEARDALTNLINVEINDDEYDEDDDYYAEHYRVKNALIAVIKDNEQLQNKFAQKFKIMARDLINTPKEVIDIDYQFDNIADNETVRSFKHYYKLFCMYRYEFGKRAADIEPFMLHTYKDEYENLRAYNAVNESMNTDEPITFTFKLHRFKPYELSLRDLSTFQDNVKACMEVFHHMYKNITSNDLLNPDVMRDGKGRMIERGNPSKIFKRWERCLLTYDLNKNQELTLNELARKASGAMRTPNKRKFNNDVDAASAAKKDIAEAERLIASASKGTFPN